MMAENVMKIETHKKMKNLRNKGNNYNFIYFLFFTFPYILLSSLPSYLDILKNITSL